MPLDAPVTNATVPSRVDAMDRSVPRSIGDLTGRGPERSWRRPRSGSSAVCSLRTIVLCARPPFRPPSNLGDVPEDEKGEDRFGAAAQADEWDARYGEQDGAKWSGRPNGRLLVEVAGLMPGEALDVGCGEGADAIWLAHNGWTVTAIDISEVALSRARAAAGQAGAEVVWLCGDALSTAFRPGSFALVSMQYPALPKAAGEVALRTLLGTVGPGGLLLAVYHDLDDEHREHMKVRGVDPEDYVGPDDLARLLGDDFTVELHAVEPRIDPPPGNPHIADVVVRARRR
jgi:SAM-dependent methyltransferase